MTNFEKVIIANRELHEDENLFNKRMTEEMLAKKAGLTVDEVKEVTEGENLEKFYFKTREQAREIKVAKIRNAINKYFEEVYSCKTS